jgi:hypothetical protein
MTAGDGWAFPFIQFGLIEKFLLLVRQTHESDVSCWRIAPECRVAVGGSADIGMRWRPEGSVANDPSETWCFCTPSQLQLPRGSCTDRFINGRWVRSVQTKTKRFQDALFC